MDQPCYFLIQMCSGRPSKDLMTIQSMAGPKRNKICVATKEKWFIITIKSKLYLCCSEIKRWWISLWKQLSSMSQQVDSAKVVHNSNREITVSLNPILIDLRVISISTGVSSKGKELVTSVWLLRFWSMIPSPWFSKTVSNTFFHLKLFWGRLT